MQMHRAEHLAPYNVHMASMWPTVSWPDHLSCDHRLKSVIQPPTFSGLLPERLQKEKMTLLRHLFTFMPVHQLCYLKPIHLQERLLTATLTRRTLISLRLCLRSARVRMRTSAVWLTQSSLRLYCNLGWLRITRLWEDDANINIQIRPEVYIV